MTKVADSYFIDPDTGKRINVQMRYPDYGEWPADTIMSTGLNTYVLSEGKVEKLDGPGKVPVYTEDPYYWRDNIRQASDNQNEPKSTLRYVADKVKNKLGINKKAGGNLNYASYLEAGGLAPNIDEIQLANLVEAMLGGDSEAEGILKQLLQQRPELGEVVQQIAESMVQQQKCGGKVRKDLRGSKLKQLDKKPVVAKSGCACVLKKVGGKLIEVDSCTGLPVHRNG